VFVASSTAEKSTAPLSSLAIAIPWAIQQCGVSKCRDQLTRMVKDEQRARLGFAGGVGWNVANDYKPLS
jgi:hypothetical protein